MTRKGLYCTLDDDDYSKVSDTVRLIVAGAKLNYARMGSIIATSTLCPVSIFVLFYGTLDTYRVEKPIIAFTSFLAIKTSNCGFEY